MCDFDRKIVGDKRMQEEDTALSNASITHTHAHTAVKLEMLPLCFITAVYQICNLLNILSALSVKDEMC